jgi:hypothetical protein
MSAAASPTLWQKGTSSGHKWTAADEKDYKVITHWVRQVTAVVMGVVTGMAGDVVPAWLGFCTCVCFCCSGSGVRWLCWGGVFDEWRFCGTGRPKKRKKEKEKRGFPRGRRGLRGCADPFNHSSRFFAVYLMGMRVYARRVLGIDAEMFDTPAATDDTQAQAKNAQEANEQFMTSLGVFVLSCKCCAIMVSAIWLADSFVSKLCPILFDFSPGTAPVSPFSVQGSPSTTWSADELFSISR